MIIHFAATLADDENVTSLDISPEEGEIIRKGDMIDIPLRNNTTARAEIVRMYSGGVTKTEVLKYGDRGDIEITGIPSNEVATENDPNWSEWEALQNCICIMPFQEIRAGNLSIYDYVKEGYTVPDKVILYLQTTEPFLMSLGIYDHPFKKGERLLGPYWYTDGKYFWDRDAWKYIVKYHVTIPQEFIDHVMSEEGTAFLEKTAMRSDSWSKRIEDLKNQEGTLCLLPDNAGDIGLEDF